MSEVPLQVTLQMLEQAVAHALTKPLLYMSLFSIYIYHTVRSWYKISHKCVLKSKSRAPLGDVRMLEQAVAQRCTKPLLYMSLFSIYIYYTVLSWYINSHKCVLK